MIDQIALRNLKRFRALDIDLAPLTLLSGLNGGGKTTLLHALLLARLASMNGGATRVPLNGAFGLALGEARDVMHEDEEIDGAIEITLRDGDAAATWRFGAEGDRSLNLRVDARPEKPPAAFAEGARRFTYLCAERLGPRDTLPVDSSALDDLQVGHQGEFTAQVLSILERRPVDPARRHPAQTTVTLAAQTESWVSAIVRPVQIFADWVAGTGVATIRFKTPGLRSQQTRPTNMGFGVSYALPIIVAGLTIERDGLLLVENPEAHLHPAGQSAMGAFLARVAGAGVQVVVETHSDHVLNGIRRAIAVDRVLPAASARAHFFGIAGDDIPHPVSLSFGEQGDVSNWPPGFFDQFETDLGSLSRARRKKG